MKIQMLQMLCLIGLGTTVAWARPPAAEADVPAVPAEEKVADGKAGAAAEPEKVCRLTGVTGSRFKRKQCHTAEQWKELELATERTMREFDRQPVAERSQ